VSDAWPRPRVEFNPLTDKREEWERPPRLPLHRPEHPRLGMMRLDQETGAIEVFIEGEWRSLFPQAAYAEAGAGRASAPLTVGEALGFYLRLDGSNDPVTGDLNFTGNLDVDGDLEIGGTPSVAGTPGIDASITYQKSLTPGDTGTLTFTKGILTGST
jgi:hypothetical protein